MHRLLALVIWLSPLALPVHAEETDVVVIGATPGGVSAAISAARSGRTVTLVEYHHHVGGMMTSGLGKSVWQTLACF